MWIKGLHGLKMNELNKNLKSVKSQNHCQLVVQKSNDIEKAHGREIIVETKEGEGSRFIIQFPIA